MQQQPTVSSCDQKSLSTQKKGALFKVAYIVNKRSARREKMIVTLARVSAGHIMNLSHEIKRRPPGPATTHTHSHTNTTVVHNRRRRRRS